MKGRGKKGSRADETARILVSIAPGFSHAADVEIGEGFDGEAYARRLRDAGADAVVVFGKCHYGHSYYHTDVGYRHPRLTIDMLAETIRGDEKHGVGVIGYYSVFLDSAAAQSHPGWQLQAEATRTDAGFDSGNFAPLCVNSAYLEELLIPQSIEMVSRYAIAEIFFDTMTGFQPCYCPACFALAGVSSHGRRPLNYGYFATSPPLLLLGKFLVVRASPGTQTLIEYLPPMSAGEGGKKFGHGHAPPAERSDEPAITLRELGKGRVAYICLPFFKAYLDNQNLYQAKLLLDLLDRLLPRPLVRIATRAQVEVAALRQGDDLIVHLVNHSGRERLGGYWYRMTEYIPEIRDIDVSIRYRPTLRDARLGPMQLPIAGRREEDYLVFRLDRLHVMESLRVPGYVA